MPSIPRSSMNATSLNDGDFWENSMILDVDNFFFVSLGKHPIEISDLFPKDSNGNFTPIDG